MWLDAKVLQWDVVKKRHLLEYTLGGTEWVFLGDEQLQWMGGGIVDGPTRGVSNTGKLVVGKTPSIFVPERNDWETCVVWEFAPRTNRVHVIFTDGREAWVAIDDGNVRWDKDTQRALAKRIAIPASTPVAAGQEKKKDDEKAAVVTTKRRRISDSAPADAPRASAIPSPATEAQATVGASPLKQPQAALPQKTKSNAQTLKPVPQQPAQQQKLESTDRPSRRTASAFGSTAVGRRVRIFIKSLMVWKYGTILHFNPESRSSLIKFEENEQREWMHLGRETVEFAAADAPPPPPPPAPPPPPPEEKKVPPPPVVTLPKLERPRQPRFTTVPAATAAAMAAMTAAATTAPASTAAAASVPGTGTLQQQRSPNQHHYRRQASAGLSRIVSELQGRGSNTASNPTTTGAVAASPAAPQPAPQPRPKPKTYPNMATPPNRREQELGPNAVMLHLPADFSMPDIPFKSAEAGGERAKLLQKKKVRRTTIEQILLPCCPCFTSASRA